MVVLAEAARRVAACMVTGEVGVKRLAASSSFLPPPQSVSRARGRGDRPPVLHLTQSAVDRLKILLDSRPEPRPAAVRLGVRTRGCNGKSYTLGYAVCVQPLEEVVEAEKGHVKVCVEPRALLSVIGSTMDYVEDALRAEFVFHNPNAKGQCGCGESFNT